MSARLCGVCAHVTVSGPSASCASCPELWWQASGTLSSATHLRTPPTAGGPQGPAATTGSLCAPRHIPSPQVTGTEAWRG